MHRTKVTFDSLSKVKNARVLCYPRYTTQEMKKRFQELKNLRIEIIEFTGQKQVYNTPVLGKGHVGIVVTAYRKSEKVALKIRRTDADRSTMEHEAKMLEKANRNNIGPRLLGITPNFLLMEYIEGTLFPEWLKTLKGKNAKKRLRQVLRSILEQAWKLDRAGLDHGELSRAPKHIIVKPDDVPCLVDFETASDSRQASNVTSLCQYFFIGNSISKMIQLKLGKIDKGKLVNALKTYKKKKDQKSFEEILKRCGIDFSKALKIREGRVLRLFSVSYSL